MDETKQKVETAVRELYQEFLGMAREAMPGRELAAIDWAGEQLERFMDQVQISVKS